MSLLPRIKDAIDRHVVTGGHCGDFVTAVLENNLKEAFVRADDHNAAHMKDIVAYCYYEIPSTAWGSPEAVAKWRELGGTKGLAEKHTRQQAEESE